MDVSNIFKNLIGSPKTVKKFNNRKKTALLVDNTSDNTLCRFLDLIT